MMRKTKVKRPIKKVRFTKNRIRIGGYGLLYKGKLVKYADSLKEAKMMAANIVRGTNKGIRIIKYEEKDNVGYY